MPSLILWNLICRQSKNVIAKLFRRDDVETILSNETFVVKQK